MRCIHPTERCRQLAELWASLHFIFFLLYCHTQVSGWALVDGGNQEVMCVWCASKNKVRRVCDFYFLFLFFYFILSLQSSHSCWRVLVKKKAKYAGGRDATATRFVCKDAKPMREWHLHTTSTRLLKLKCCAVAKWMSCNRMLLNECDVTCALHKQTSWSEPGQL